MKTIQPLTLTWNKLEEVGPELYCCAIGDNIKLYPKVQGVVIKGSIRKAYNLINRARRMDEELRQYPPVLMSDDVKFKLLLPFGLCFVIYGFALIEGWSDYEGTKVKGVRIQ